MLGERWRGRNWTESWQIGKAAFRSRLFGTMAKAFIGLLMIGVLIVTLLRSVWVRAPGAATEPEPAPPIQQADAA